MPPQVRRARLVDPAGVSLELPSYGTELNKGRVLFEVDIYICVYIHICVHACFVGDGLYTGMCFPLGLKSLFLTSGLS